MKVAAHPLVVAVAMGLLGPGVLAEEAEAESEPCMDCGADEASLSDADPVASALEGFAVFDEIAAPEASHPSDRDVDAWLAHPVPTPETQAHALAEYLASTEA